MLDAPLSKDWSAITSVSDYPELVTTEEYGLLEIEGGVRVYFLYGTLLWSVVDTYVDVTLSDAGWGQYITTKGLEVQNSDNTKRVVTHRGECYIEIIFSDATPPSIF